jgi:hypothetical protein
VSSRTLRIAAWVLCLASGAYALRFLTRGWIPHDEGTIGQSAERVLAGELPHRDFDEVYTGGLTYLNAAAMRVAGMNLRAPRVLLFAAFLAYVAAALAFARRVSGPAAALAAVALIVVWSVPNYFASLPSWYVLFGAAFGSLALIRFLEDRRRVWLVVAGACGGVSVLMKIPGVFYLAAALLFFLYVEQHDAAEPEGSTSRRSWWWAIAALPVAACAGLMLYLAAVRATALPLLQLFLPILVVSGFVAWHERRAARAPAARRAAALSRMVAPFAAGALLPILAFAGVYWWQDGLGALLRGVFVLPQRRLTEATIGPPPLATFGLALPYAALILININGRGRLAHGWVPAAALSAILALVLVFVPQPVVYRGVWAVARWMPLVAAIAAVPRLRSHPDPRLFLLVAMSAALSLIQFPYATPIYFCYAAPMTVLAMTALVSAPPRAPLRLHAVVAAFFFLFALLFVNRSYGWNLGVQFIRYDPASRLDLPRAGLLVPDDDRRTYEAVIRRVQERAAGGTIYAGPDCPEIYFLSGFRNPTRALFEFLGPDRLDRAAMAHLLATQPIRAAVINTAPLFSPPIEAGAMAELERRFPGAERIGRFIVRFD